MQQQTLQPDVLQNCKQARRSCATSSNATNTVYNAADLVIRATQEGASASVKDCICGGTRGGALLGDLVAQIFHHDLVATLVQHSKAVAGNEDCR